MRNKNFSKRIFEKDVNEVDFALLSTYICIFFLDRPKLPPRHDSPAEEIYETADDGDVPATPPPLPSSQVSVYRSPIKIMYILSFKNITSTSNCR